MEFCHILADSDVGTFLAFSTHCEVLYGNCHGKKWCIYSAKRQVCILSSINCFPWRVYIAGVWQRGKPLSPRRGFASFRTPVPLRQFFSWFSSNSFQLHTSASCSHGKALSLVVALSVTFWINEGNILWVYILFIRYVGIFGFFVLGYF